MSLIAKTQFSPSKFVSVPSGMHLARCFRIIDLGTQPSRYMGVEKKRETLMLQFEIHSEGADGKPLLTNKGEPLSIAQRYSNSMLEKAKLRLHLESWRGAGFTNDEIRTWRIHNVLGHWAMLNVTENLGNDGKTYTNIETINPVPSQIKKAGLPEPHNELLVYDIDESPPESFEKLSENIKKTIMNSPEWQEKHKKTSAQGFYDDDISDINEPF